MRLRLDASGHGAKVDLHLTQKIFKESYLWDQKLATGIMDKLDQKFQEEVVWEALRKLTKPAAWRSAAVPEEELANIAAHFELAPAQLRADWLAMRPALAAKLGPAPALGEVPDPEFRSGTLLPGLAWAEKSLLRRLLVTAAITIGNTARLERDMEASCHMWHQRTKNIEPKKLGMQVRLGLNFTERTGGRRSESVAVARSVTAQVKVEWD